MQKLKITCDAAPFTSFTKLLERCFELGGCLGSGVDLPDELIRVESDDVAVNTGELVVRLYPSDSLLRFLGTLRTRNLDGRVVDSV